MDLFSSPPPLAPPTTEEKLLAWLRLLRSRRVGPATFFRLMHDHCGDAAAALEALPGIAAAAGVTDYAPCPRDLAAAELARGRKIGAVPVFFSSPDYPVALADLDEPPPFLWLKGRRDLLHQPLVALVGARNASSLGLRMARTLGKGLGEAGVGIVSGLARGIDAAAHEAALPTGTIAVVAGGVDVVYPAENATLMARIGDIGLIVSEMPPGLQPQARHFPQRNRIISGLARGVVVVEAAPKSGSLITARDAADQGREVMAVPGHPFDERAAGCNMLIRDGATLVRGAADVLAATAIAPAGTAIAADTAAFDPRKSPAPHTTTGPPSLPRPGCADAALPDRILGLLGPSPLPEDQLMRDLAQPARTIGAALLSLELEGRVARQPGGLLCRID